MGETLEPTPGAATFQNSGDAYDLFMGRYARPLAVQFADAAGIGAAGVNEIQSALDVGCGPGALTGELVRRLGATGVSALDPSEPFVAACSSRHAGVDVRQGRAEAIPFEDARFDVALAQLVLHFVTDPPAAAAEMARVVGPGGSVGACVWDFAEGMEMLRWFWDAALAVDPDAPDEARTLRFGREGEIVDLFAAAGLEAIVETTLDVSSVYQGFDELWAGFLAGIGPAGSWLLSQPEPTRAAVRTHLFGRVGSPASGFSLQATARCAVARVPG